MMAADSRSEPRQPRRFEKNKNMMTSPPGIRWWTRIPPQVFLNDSSLACLSLTLQVARTLERGVIVTVFPDGAEKYLTENFWTAE